MHLWQPRHVASEAQSFTSEATSACETQLSADEMQLSTRCFVQMMMIMMKLFITSAFIHCWNKSYFFTGNEEVESSDMAELIDQVLKRPAQERCQFRGLVLKNCMKMILVTSYSAFSKFLLEICIFIKYHPASRFTFLRTTRDMMVEEGINLFRNVMQGIPHSY
uniref:Uncharacterized protein n=1 Tax=Romanomermis culicivorax TaxID=13658 RepID=A0A915KWI4_ROMCU